MSLLELAPLASPSSARLGIRKTYQNRSKSELPDSPYVISNRDLKDQINELNFQVELRPETPIYVDPGNLRATVLHEENYSIDIEEGDDSVRVLYGSENQVVSFCKTQWNSTKYAEIGGATDEGHRGRGLFAVSIQ